MVVGHIELASLKTFINQLELNILKFKLSYIPNKMVVLGKIVLHFLVVACPSDERQNTSGGALII